MSSLRTNYKDDVFTGSRKYEMTQNGDGTVSFTDQTTYSQVGDTYGAAQINETNAIVNNLDDKAYLSDDGTESGLADNDTFPFFDISANARKKTTWSNIKNLIKAICAIKDHASSTASTYGAGTGSQFGHVKLSDTYLSSSGAAANSVGASSAAVNSAYNKLNNQLKANNKEIYMDYKNGEYGYNTSANRGADTFHPFRNIKTDNCCYICVSARDTEAYAYNGDTKIYDASLYWQDVTITCKNFKIRATYQGDESIRVIVTSLDKGIYWRSYRASQANVPFTLVSAANQQIESFTIGAASYYEFVFVS